MKIGTVLLLLAAIVGGGWSYYFGIHHVQAYKMNDVVGTAALTWVALGETRAHQKLDEELRRREIPEYVTPENCTFYEDAGEKTVECSWVVDVYLPFVADGRRMRFRVAKTALANGELISR